jgi:hypothetical protein
MRPCSETDVSAFGTMTPPRSTDTDIIQNSRIAEGEADHGRKPRSVSGTRNIYSSSFQPQRVYIVNFSTIHAALHTSRIIGFWGKATPLGIEPRKQYLGFGELSPGKTVFPTFRFALSTNLACGSRATGSTSSHYLVLA